MTTESTCSETLRQQGKPYPRTCRKCGLGPCVGKPVTTPPASQEQAKWCEHVASAVDCWVRNARMGYFAKDQDAQIKAIAGIIERRLWALKREANQEQAQQPSGGEVWIQPDHLQKARVAPFLCRVSPTQDAPDFVPLTLATPKPEPMTWQPIETAPENTGGLVVVRWLDSDGAVCNELDHTDDGCWMGWHEHAEQVEIIGGHGVSYTPPYTHWMPLPDAPGITSTSTKEQA